MKEAVHIKTGQYYACKVINKKLMEGREHMVRNEIAVLKKVSQGHPNIVTLHDYFETAHNLYLIFDLCSGGELFDRICAKGNYYEADAADLVRTIMKAVEYIHRAGIVHRDLKPENLIFRTKAEDAEVMIADFGLSRIMDDSTFTLLTEVCGTPGYMAPEIFKKSESTCYRHVLEAKRSRQPFSPVGHSKPVDVWAMGVITYFLLCGYTPFDRENQQEEAAAICRGDYKFEPEEYWQNVSETAKSFVRACLTIDQHKRPTASEALKHPWLASAKPHFVVDPQSSTGQPADLLPQMQKAFNAKKTCESPFSPAVTPFRSFVLVVRSTTSSSSPFFRFLLYLQDDMSIAQTERTLSLRDSEAGWVARLDSLHRAAAIRPSTVPAITQYHAPRPRKRLGDVPVLGHLLCSNYSSLAAGVVC